MPTGMAELDSSFSGNQPIVQRSLRPLPDAPRERPAPRDDRQSHRTHRGGANGWLGEIEGLKTSQTAAIAELASVNRAERNRNGKSALPAPVVRRRE